ncbi:hypothetical protein, partial [Aquabacterium sp.]|uniref:hypothetical protein n=1 Tax=Aquabacterium sp. TaxID=1872578 RepID=UPI0025C23D23
SHLRHGHVEFIRDKLKAKYIAEAIETEDSPSASEIRQALEIDADCGATLHSLNRAFFAFRAHTQARDSFSELDWAIVKHAYGSNALATRSICFSAYILFRIFNVGSWRIDLQPKLTHPLPPFRAYAIGATAYEIFSQRTEYEYNADLFMLDHSHTIESAEFAFTTIAPDEYKYSYYDNVANSEYTDFYISRFQRTWSGISPLLERYKRGGTIPK